MSAVILQTPSTFETRKVHAASMLLDHSPVFHVGLPQLDAFREHLQADAMPVGSVEFVRAAMALAGITEPANLSYPEVARPYLRRDVHVRCAGDVSGRWFVKPVATKTFTGFVVDTAAIPAAVGRHDQEQHRVFATLPHDTLVYVCEPVRWLSEWRYYIAQGSVVGAARYDIDGDDHDLQPDRVVVQACIADLAIEHPYAVDFGVLGSGETALVEVNDAWAIGLYGDALSSRTYLAFLRSRWRSLRRATSL